MHSKGSDNKQSRSDLILLNRLDRTVKGSLTVLLILGIINQYKSIYGWKIKKILKDITNADSYIKDSSLYTILRHLEKNQKIITSEMRDRRRYYSLTETGSLELKQSYDYWMEIVNTSIKAFRSLKLEL